MELHCERPTTNLILTKICARTKILKFWSQIRVMLKVGGRVWLVLGWFKWSMLIWIWPNWPKLIGLTWLGIFIQTSWICFWISYLMLDLIHNSSPPNLPHKVWTGPRTHFFKVSAKSAHPHCTVCKILDTFESLFFGVQDRRWVEDHITAFQGLEDTLACLAATYLNLEIR